MRQIKIACEIALLLLVTGCSTAVAIVDTAGAAVVYTGAAVVKGVGTVGGWAVNAVTPDKD